MKRPRGLHDNVVVRVAARRARADTDSVIELAKALVRRDGLRVPASSSAWVPTRIAELDLSSALTTELAPALLVYAALNEQIVEAGDEVLQ